MGWSLYTDVIDKIVASVTCIECYDKNDVDICFLIMMMFYCVYYVYQLGFPVIIQTSWF